MPPYVIAGTDEAGRGPLAGPVVAAAAVLTIEQRELLLSLGLNDSKKLTAKKREKIFAAMCEAGVEWRAQAASPRVIDRINILNASLWCMKRSVERLRVCPNLVLVDGNRLVPGLTVRQKAVIKGDSRVPAIAAASIAPAIAAASIAAKVLRDRVMESLDKIYPQYQFAKHKGYPSALHRALVAEYGPSPVHRLSFRGAGGDED